MRGASTTPSSLGALRWPPHSQLVVVRDRLRFQEEERPVGDGDVDVGPGFLGADVHATGAQQLGAPLPPVVWLYAQSPGDILGDVPPQAPSLLPQISPN